MKASRYWRFCAAHLSAVAVGGLVIQSGWLSREASLVVAYFCLIAGVAAGFYWTARNAA